MPEIIEQIIREKNFASSVMKVTEPRLPKPSDMRQRNAVRSGLPAVG